MLSILFRGFYMMRELDLSWSSMEVKRLATVGATDLYNTGYHTNR